MAALADILEHMSRIDKGEDQYWVHRAMIWLLGSHSQREEVSPTEPSPQERTLATERAGSKDAGEFSHSLPSQPPLFGQQEGSEAPHSSISWEVAIEPHNKSGGAHTSGQKVCIVLPAFSCIG